MYLMLTTSVSDQTISESTPYTFSLVGAMPYSGLKHSRNAYSGLVPMSPYTTPSAVIVRIARRLPLGLASTVGRSAGIGRAAVTPVGGVELRSGGTAGSGGSAMDTNGREERKTGRG